MAGSTHSNKTSKSKKSHKSNKSNKSRQPTNQQSTSIATEPERIRDSSEQSSLSRTTMMTAPEITHQGPAMTHQDYNRRPILKIGPIFEGPKGALAPTAWIKQYDIHAKWMNWSEVDKIEAIGMHLSGVALKWYSSTILEVRELYSLDWHEFKEAFLERFDHKTDSPLDKWLDYTLEKSNDVATYFNEKVHLGNLARQNLENQISGLTRGMPSRYRMAFATSGRVSTINAWLAMAQKLESAYSKTDRAPVGKPFNQVRRDNTGNNSVKPEASRTTAPKVQCQICAKQGKPGQMHWHSQCPNKLVGRVNVAEDVDQEDHQGNEESSLDN